MLEYQTQATGVSSLGVVFSSGSGSAVQGVAMVIEEQIELDPTTETIEIITYSAKIAVYPADKAIRRLVQRLESKHTTFLTTTVSHLSIGP